MTDTEARLRPVAAASPPEERRLPGTGGGYQIIANPPVFASTAAAVLARRIAALSDQERITVALSGGATPEPVYRALAADERIDWTRIEIFFADERLVPFSDPASNYAMVRAALLDSVPVAPGRIHPLPAEAADLDAALAAYGEGLPERFDLIVLGVGADGHTASLFPDAESLTTMAPVARARAPSPPHERLTLTPPVIQAARLLVVLARGREKGDAIRTALAESGDVAACPARLARRGIWVLDREAVASWREGPRPTREGARP